MSSLPTTLEQQFTAAGLGWQAEIHLGYMLLAVDPMGDSLPAALEALTAPSQRGFWTVDWAYEDEAGRDVYVVERMRPAEAC